MLLVLLLTSAFSFVGCSRGDNKYILMKSYNINYHSPIDLTASSNSKIFSKENITLDLSYAMHSINHKGESDIEPDYYNYKYLQKYDIIYGLYIADSWDYKSANYDRYWYTDDIKNIENYHFVKMISEEEALSEKYLSVSPWFACGYGFDKYNHTEKITIPKEFASEKQGYFVIFITMFAVVNNSYMAIDSAKIECYYNEIDENTIEIDMHDWKYFRIM